MTVHFGAGRSSDFPAVLSLNEAAVPAVNSIDEPTLQRLHQEAETLLVARDGESLAGFLLAMNEGANYESVNFRYFKANYPRFVYIDRIVVNPDFRRRGIGAGLYRALHTQTPDDAMLACEVNLRPPNPGSLDFHSRLGFRVVAEQDTDSGAKRVALMIREP